MPEEIGLILKRNPFTKVPVIFRKILSSSWLGCLMCIAGLTASLYWRRPDAFYNPQLWAEDGAIFFPDAFFQGLKSLVIPYAGYFHILARFVAWLGSLLPVRYVPHWYEFASWLLLVGIIVYIFSRRFPFGGGLKLLLGLALVATTADNEVFFNLANWAFLCSFFWLLLSVSSEPQSRGQSLFDVFLLTLAGLNTPFAVCLWPLFLLRWGIRRTRHSLILFGLSLIVAAIQFWNMPGRIEAGGMIPAMSRTFADVLIYRFGFIFLGEHIYKLQLTDPLRFLVLIGMGVFYGGLIWLALRKKNWPALSIISGGLVAAALSLYVMRQIPAALIHSAGRHFFIPAVTLAWGLLLTDNKPNYWRWVPLAMIFTAFLFFTPAYKNEVWPDLDWAGKTAQCVGTRPECRIPVNPVWNPPVWFATMSSHVFRVPATSKSMSERFGEQIGLVGYEGSQNSTTLDLKLIWRALGKMQGDYAYFVVLFSPGDPTRIHIQEEMPLNGQYPTSRWLLREVITDEVTLSLTPLQPGEYQIGVGWYDPASPDKVPLPAYEPSTGRTWNDNLVVLPLKIDVH